MRHDPFANALSLMLSSKWRVSRRLKHDRSLVRHVSTDRINGVAEMAVAMSAPRLVSSY